MISHFLANELLDLYGNQLTARQKQILELYFAEDYSLSEIEEMLSISRAAVHDAISKGVKAMISKEDDLHLFALVKAQKKVSEEYPEFQDLLEKAYSDALENWQTEKSS